MKKPKAEKLKSGNYRSRIQIDGQRYSVTAATKKEAQDKAMQLYLGYEAEKKSPLTVGKAVDRYISEKQGTLSPSTIRGYKTIKKNYLHDISEINLNELTQSDVQMLVSEMAMNGKSPKTIRNVHGLLASVLDMYRPNFVLKTRLPQKEHYDVRIFSEEEMRKVWTVMRGTNYELPFLMACWLGLRMSEIRGLKYSDIREGRAHIHSAVVMGENGPVEKGPKTTSGDRWIKLPKEILTLIGTGKPENYICPYTHSMIYKAFIQACKKAGVEPCRFHDLRHFSASESLALGVPDKYSMKRMGHKTDNMLKNVYQHTMQEKEDAFSDKIDAKMRDIFKSGHEFGHEDQTVSWYRR